METLALPLVCQRPFMRAEFCASQTPWATHPGSVQLVGQRTRQKWQGPRQWPTLCRSSTLALPGGIAATLHLKCHKRDGCIAYLAVRRQTRNVWTANKGRQQNPHMSLQVAGPNYEMRNAEQLPTDLV